MLQPSTWRGAPTGGLRTCCFRPGRAASVRPRRTFRNPRHRSLPKHRALSVGLEASLLCLFIWKPLSGRGGPVGQDAFGEKAGAGTGRRRWGQSERHQPAESGTAAPRPPDAISPSKPPCHLPPGNPGVKVLSLESPFKIQDPRPASQPQHSTVCQALSLQAGCWSPGRDQGSLDGCSGERVLPRGREAGHHRSRNAAEQPLPLLSWALAGPA